MDCNFLLIWRYELKQAKDGTMYVPDLVVQPVNNLEDVQKVIELGRKNRAVESTNLNEHSSRSHAYVLLFAICPKLPP